jgi:hypothetical protein
MAKCTASKTSGSCITIPCSFLCCRGSWYRWLSTKAVKSITQTIPSLATFSLHPMCLIFRVVGSSSWFGLPMFRQNQASFQSGFWCILSSIHTQSISDRHNFHAQVKVHPTQPCSWHFLCNRSSNGSVPGGKAPHLTIPWNRCSTMRS